jgi:hypothetical protein
MGSNQSIPTYSPLFCLLKNLGALNLMPDLKPKKLTCLCFQIWPQYQLDNSNHLPEYGTFDPAILQDMNSFLQQNGK